MMPARGILGQPSRCRQRSDDGYILVGVIILVAVFMISLAVAVPKIREEIQRDQELETLHRGQQYIRAIQLYYRRFHRYPADIDALVDSNGLRFLRKRYADPLTGEDDWIPVVLGQNHAPLSMGYFGQALSLGAAAPPTLPKAGTNGILGSSPASAFDSFSDAPNSKQDQSSTPPTVYGGSIIGVSPPLKQSSLLIYKTKQSYDEWEFVYDPLADRTAPALLGPTYGGPPTIGTPGLPVPIVPHQ